MNTVAASVPVLRWAAARAHLRDDTLTKRFPKWPLWLEGRAQPTLRQLEDFARLSHVAIGFFFLPEPPELKLPVPDYRTLRDTSLLEPGSNLLDTLYLCQQRQEWYREYARIHGLEEIAFIGSASTNDSPMTIAKKMRDRIGLSLADRRVLPTWTDALRSLVDLAGNAGILVMISSIVGSNTHRKLDVEEFRGFALVDSLAPLVFLNSSDSKAAQMFTLAHELAHLWLGKAGVSNIQAVDIPENRIEKWCNSVAAEFLMPLDDVKHACTDTVNIPEQIQHLAREYKVSTLVALRRLHDAGLIDRETLWKQYRDEEERVRKYQSRNTGGGDFYRTLGTRVGKRFARAIIANTLEGQTLFRDAFQMLGMRKNATFYKAARELGVSK